MDTFGFVDTASVSHDTLGDTEVVILCRLSAAHGSVVMTCVDSDRLLCMLEPLMSMGAKFKAKIKWKIRDESHLTDT